MVVPGVTQPVPMSPVRLLSLPCPAVRRLLGWQQGAEEEYWAQMAAHALVKKLEKKARPLVELEKVLWCPGQPNRCVMLPASLPGRWGAGSAQQGAAARHLLPHVALARPPGPPPREC